jgi:hypothetical protein
MSEPARAHWRRYRILYLIIAVSVAPVVASYFAFYVMPPSGRMNYGTLVEPLRPTPAVTATRLDGSPFDFNDLSGHWVLTVADSGACDAPCVDKLFFIRQQHTMTGRDRARVERLWLITDDVPVRPELLRDFDGMHFVRIRHAAVESFLASPDQTDAEVTDHMWMIDPMGNLMIRWPRNADPAGVKRDIARLLTASRHWVRIERKSDR